ncbi:MAG: type I-G CRISPR-associated protein Cas8g1/Csx17 [Myxococcales bacterium]|jgi:CRISPR-associated protein Csx17
MSVHVHRLAGCAPQPLAHYLKALGVLRLVSEQADPSARGWWRDECFWLATRLGREEMSEFFLYRYSPTPLVAPWNRGSGFYAKSEALARAEKSVAGRFASLREGIAAARGLLGESAAADVAVRAIKAETKVKGLSRAARDKLRRDANYRQRLAEAENRYKSLKAILLPRCRGQWRGPHREWLDAAVVLDDAGKAAWPALFGTGGTDGNLDFAYNFFQRLGDVFDVEGSGDPLPEAADWLDNALWGEPATALMSAAVGQYSPGGAGGANSTVGPEGGSLLNPADFLLMLEGAVLFSAGLCRRLDRREASAAVAPFTTFAHAAAYASAGGSEKQRGEQWMPLWDRPLVLTELRHLLAEGRSRLGAQPASEPLHFARAVARLGVARGLSGFERYGFIERNGQSNLAVSLGRLSVPERASPVVALLDDLDGWMERLRRQARDDHAPTRLKVAERALADAAFAAAAHPAEPARWQRLLLALDQVERVLATGAGFAAGPVPKLQPGWVRSADDGSAELRLAVAFGLQAASFRGRWPQDPVRRHWLPLDKNGRAFATRGTDRKKQLAEQSDVVVIGRDPVADALALVQRRLIEGAQKGCRHLPLQAAFRAAAHPADLARLVAGELDLAKTLALGRALGALDAAAWARQPLPPRAPASGLLPDEAWIALRLATLPWPLEKRDPGGDPAIVRRLAAGDASGALEVALRRLRAAGIGFSLRAGDGPPETARLWGAALAFPINLPTAKSFADRIDPAAHQ